MKVVHSLAELPSISSSVLTIGNFDGLHLGHAAILAAVRERASGLGASAVGMTFHPHPLEQVAPDRAPVPISTLQQRIELIRSTGIDLLLVQNFDQAFSRLSPRQFVETYLLGALRARALCVGYNFRFGHEHRGNVETLRAWQDRFEVFEIPPVVRAGCLVSSSRIRELLRAGEVSGARRLLGRCYEISGRIVAGEGRGRKTTVPTLNLDPDNRSLLEDGVYLTRASIDGGDGVDALTNVGMRPTFGGSSRTVETHLLRSRGAGGGDTMRIRFLKRLRDERKFPDGGALRAQILTDIDAAEHYFRRLSRVRNAALPHACSPGGAL